MKLKSILFSPNSSEIKEKLYIQNNFRMKYGRFRFFPIITLILLSGCYQMDKKEQLSILITDSRVKYDDLEYYLDSILKKDLVIPDSIHSILIGDGNTLREFEKVIYFSENPKEYFTINLFGNPIVIERMVNMSLSNYAIYRKDDLSEEQIERIKRRFKVELLDKVVAYTKNKSGKKDIDKTPDSLNNLQN